VNGPRGFCHWLAGVVIGGGARGPKTLANAGASLSPGSRETRASCRLHLQRGNEVRTVATAVLVASILLLAHRGCDSPLIPSEPTPLPRDGTVRVVAVFESEPTDLQSQIAISSSWGSVAWREKADLLRYYDPDSPPAEDSIWRPAFDLLSPGPKVLVAKDSKVRISDLPTDIAALIDEVTR
jgi:hypothetical protein